MTKILAIESSTQICSIALFIDGEVDELSVSGQRSHTANLLGFVKELLGKHGLQVSDLDLIAFSAGPGSFTGIRLAASVAKSLAYAVNIPVLGVSSLAVIAQAGKAKLPGLSQCLVITDAKMDEAYVGSYGFNDGLAEASGEDALVNVSSLGDLVKTTCPIVTADKEFIHSQALPDRAEFVVVEPSACLIIPLAKAMLESGQFGSSLDVQVNYLRGKSGWKTKEQQKSI